MRSELTWYLPLHPTPASRGRTVERQSDSGPMGADLARRISNYYLAIGIAGTVGELMLVEYVLTSGV